MKRILMLCLCVLPLHASQKGEAPPAKSQRPVQQNVATVLAGGAAQAAQPAPQVPNSGQASEGCIMDILGKMTAEEFQKVWNAAGSQAAKPDANKE